jgi:hypothetical protein
MLVRFVTMEARLSRLTARISLVMQPAGRTRRSDCIAAFVQQSDTHKKCCIQRQRVLGIGNFVAKALK